LIGAVLLTSTARAQGANDVATLSDIVALEQTWLKSQQTNNTEILTPLLADNIADTSTEGKLMSGKAAVIADAKSVQWSSAEYTDMQVAVYGDAAIATAVFTGKGVDSAGHAVNVHERYTDTWVKMSDGHWRCVASHGSLIKT
ncbi:MAG TPA: nuclear transport factor 2 family protein, partial [Steroidobacteraceae bacterium]|nr:nuclear transport factor 2 family protein [Steroidobacteraceae bacterium]